jgi:hypothetical protein
MSTERRIGLAIAVVLLFAAGVAVYAHITRQQQGGSQVESRQAVPPSPVSEGSPVSRSPVSRSDRGKHLGACWLSVFLS